MKFLENIFFKIKKKAPNLDVSVCIHNPSMPVLRWEVEAGEAAWEFAGQLA